MPHREQRILRLEIDPGADPITGRLTDAAGFEATFTGWVSLAAAIERAVSRDGEASKVGGRTLMNRLEP